MKKNYKKGFTLIELLVVIAIIGILSSVVLASLNSARAKGSDAAIKADLSNLRAAAELYFDGTGANSYGTGGGCATGSEAGMFLDSSILNILKHAKSQAGSALVDCSSTADAWAVEAKLKTNATDYFCVDSIGTAAVRTTAIPLAGPVCPAV
jgi:prepilin-type N-terminal cleavage/methylation domain-containing protein